MTDRPPPPKWSDASIFLRSSGLSLLIQKLENSGRFEPIDVAVAAVGGFLAKGRVEKADEAPPPVRERGRPVAALPLAVPAVAEVGRLRAVAPVCGAASSSSRSPPLRVCFWPMDDRSTGGDIMPTYGEGYALMRPSVALEAVAVVGV